MADAGRKRLASSPSSHSDTELPCISIDSEESSSSSSNDESIGFQLDRRQRRKKAKLSKLALKDESSDPGSSAVSSAKGDFRKPKAVVRQRASKGEFLKEAHAAGVCPSAKKERKRECPIRDPKNRSEGDCTMLPLPAGGQQPSSNSKKGRERAAAVSKATGPGLDMPVLDTEECGKQDRAHSPATNSAGGKERLPSQPTKGSGEVSRSSTSGGKISGGVRGTVPVDQKRRCSEAVQKKKHSFALMTEKIDNSLLPYQQFHKFIKNYIAGRKVIEIRAIRNNQHYLIAFESPRDAAHVLELCNADKGRVTLKPAGEGEKVIRSYPLVVLRVPNSISEEEFLELASEGGNPVLSATRLKSRARQGASIEKMKVIVDSLDSRNDLLDRGFRLGFQLLPTESWLVAPSLPRCRFCQGYQHITRNCPGSVPKCGYCGEDHKSSECRKKAEPQAYRCANCGGQHRSDNYGCPLRKQVISQLPQRLTYAEIVSLRARGMTPRDVREAEVTVRTDSKPKPQEKTSTASRPADAIVSGRDASLSNTKTQGQRGTQAPSVPQIQTQTPSSSSPNTGSSLNATGVNWNSMFSDIMGFFTSEHKSMADLLQIIMKWSPVLLNFLGKFFATSHHG